MKQIFIAAGFVVALTFASLNTFAQTESRDDLLKQIAAKRAELAKLERAYLAPSEEDQARYAEFLRQRNTGLIRLLPRETVDSSNSALNLRGGGAYYSFKERTNEYVNSSDLSLEQGQFSTGFAGANYGLLARLGDVPLESVSIETGAAHFLAQQTPAPDEPKARVEQHKSAEGTIIDGITYKGRVPMQLNNTYVLRAVNYYASDSLVAFRVVRVDNDDSVIILWKVLQKYPTPYLARI
jgi:hypothetical protein